MQSITTLNATLNYCLYRYREVDPEFVKKLKESFYMDDVITSEQNSDKVRSLYEKAKARLTDAGFRHSKWLTNDSDLAEKTK